MAFYLEFLEITSHKQCIAVDLKDEYIKNFYIFILVLILHKGKIFYLDTRTQNLLNNKNKNSKSRVRAIQEAQITKHANFKFSEHLTEYINILIINSRQIQHRKEREENNILR